jgi:FkbM family methyltransferase
VNNIYSQLPVEGKTVIDIGANIADSSIYFALRGAHKVIGIEPFPRNYRLARKNIIQNKLSDQIVVILAACAATDGEVEIDPTYQSTIGSTLRDIEFKNGDKVPLLTLRSIVNRHKSGADDPLILKMDCEGCEYDTILSADETTLQDFSYIIIEYHYGYKNLEEKLKKNGFSVSRTRTKIYKWKSRTVREGYIVAKKEENESKLSHPVK